MSWSPALKTINTRAVADNLLAYFAANQADAILWANGSALRPFSQFTNSVANRTAPVFPCIAFASDEDAEDFGDGDVIESKYSVVFEVIVESQDPNTAVSEARGYMAAIVSMIRNCPAATVAANTGSIVSAVIVDSIETQFDEIRTNDDKNDFFQTVQVRTIFTLKAGAYS